MNEKLFKITIAKSKLDGDIPTYEFTESEVKSDHFIFLDDQIENEKVIVCFPSFDDAKENKDWENEHPEFFIVKDPYEASRYYFNFIEEYQFAGINFNFFCFETFEEAFDYCKDLKEGM
jgi:hypothetical protein